MTLLDHVGVVRGGGARSGLEVAGLRTQAHRRTQVRHVLLLREEVDDGMRGGRIEFAGVGAGEPADAPSDLDHGALKAEADPQEGHLVLTRVAGGVHLAFDTPNPEPTGDQDAVHGTQSLLGRVASEVVRRDPMDLDVASVVDAPVAESLHDRQIGVPEVHVLADHRDIDHLRRRMHAVDEGRPLRKVGGRDDLEMVRQKSIQSLLVQHEGDLVDGWSVGSTDHAADGHVAEQRDLLLQVPTDRTVRAAHDGIGLQTQGTKFLHGVLRRLRLQFARRPDVRHQ